MQITGFRVALRMTIQMLGREQSLCSIKKPRRAGDGALVEN
jgi:hypothetical protein